MGISGAKVIELQVVPSFTQKISGLDFEFHLKLKEIFELKKLKKRKKKCKNYCAYLSGIISVPPEGTASP
jgi:hypothetical protein